MMQLSEVVPFLLLEQRCGMTCQAMLRRPRRCRCSRTGWRHTCSAAATKLFDFNDISFPSHYLSFRISGPCNSFYCLGHFKNVYDDDTIRHECYFNVRSKADMSQLNLPHGTNNKKVENRKSKKVKKQICWEVPVNSPGNPCSPCVWLSVARCTLSMKLLCYVGLGKYWEFGMGGRVRKTNHTG